MEDERTPKGQFPVGTSGNKLGRPKGSKNKVTLLKLMAEEAARERNYDKANAVIDLIYEQALEGDKASQKLVWDANMSKGSIDDRTQAQEKVTIQIGGMPEATPPKATIIDHEEIIDGEQDEVSDE